LFWKHSKNRMELIHFKPMKQLKEATYKPWIFSSATYDSGTSNRRLLQIQHGRLQSQKMAYFAYFKHMCVGVKYPEQVTEMTNPTTMISTFTRLTTQLVILG
jgi:hypothetical protein